MRQLNTRLPEALIERLAEVAAARGVSQRELIERAIATMLEAEADGAWEPEYERTALRPRETR